jgi:hypothetical protein
VGTTVPGVQTRHLKVAFSPWLRGPDGATIGPDDTGSRTMSQHTARLVSRGIVGLTIAMILGAFVVAQTSFSDQRPGESW